MNRGGFSWKRALGVTKAKRRISRATHIPLTKSGRQRKVGKAMMGGGCLVTAIGMISIVIFAVVLIVLYI
jgi:predicted RNA-binding protein